MLLNGTKSNRCVALSASKLPKFDKTNIKTKHASFAKKFSEITRVPELPVITFVDGAFDRHVTAIEQLVKWGSDDYTITSDLVGSVTNKTSGSNVEQSIDLSQD